MSRFRCHECFNDPSFADLRIHFTSHDSRTSQDATAPSAENETLSFFAHKVILAHCSPVIKSLLLRKQVKRTGRKRTRKEMEEEVDIEEQVEEHDLDVLELPVEEGEDIAAQLLLRCCVYSQDLASTLNTLVEAQPADQDRKPAVKALIMGQLYRMLDRFQIDTDLCYQVMNKLVPEDCGEISDVHSICDVITSLPALEDTPPLKRLKSLCYQRLLSWFQHVPKTIQSILLRLNPDGYSFCAGGSIPDFLDLNFRAVELLVEDVDNKLQVVSENDIVALLSLWLHHQQDSLGQPCTEFELTTLSGHIRLVHLSSSYLGQLPFIAPWCDVLESTVRTLQTSRMMCAEMKNDNVDSLLCKVRATEDHAKVEQRSILQGKDAASTFSWSFSADELTHWHDKMAAVDQSIWSTEVAKGFDGSILKPSSCERGYFNGYLLSLDMKASTSRSRKSKFSVFAKLLAIPPFCKPSKEHVLIVEGVFEMKTNNPRGNLTLVRCVQNWCWVPQLHRITHVEVSDDPRSCFLAEFRDMGGSGAMEVKLTVTKIY